MITPHLSGVEVFVTRFYILVLGRSVDQGGLDYWSDQIISGTETPGEVAIGFFSSAEYVNLNHDNPTFVDTVYHAFFDRAADQGGKDYWSARLENSMTRIQVVEGFIDSQEFQDLIVSFEI